MNQLVDELQPYKRSNADTGSVSNVLIIYTGGTIGMLESSTGLGLTSGVLGELMARERSFHGENRGVLWRNCNRC